MKAVNETADVRRFGNASRLIPSLLAYQAMVSLPWTRPQISRQCHNVREYYRLLVFNYTQTILKEIGLFDVMQNSNPADGS